MFLKLCFKSLWRQKMKTSLLVAINVLAIAVSTSLLGLVFDIRSKVQEELKSFGPNFVIQSRVSSDSSNDVTLRGGKGFPEKKLRLDNLTQVVEILGENAIICPHLMGVLEIESQARSVRGVEFDAHRRLLGHWEIRGRWASRLGEIMLGENIAQSLKVGIGQGIKLGNRIFRICGIYKAGDLWDEEILISLEDVRSFENDAVWAFSVEARVDGTLQELEKKGAHIEMIFPGVKASPLRRVAVSEGQILDKIQNLIWIVNALIFGIMILTVIATSVALVSERREEFALMQSLGASVARLVYTFYMEVILACLVSAPLGFLIGQFGGNFLAGHLLSHTIPFQWITVPWTLGAVLTVILLGGSLAVRRILAIEPAGVLKGE